MRTKTIETRWNKCHKYLHIIHFPLFLSSIPLLITEPTRITQVSKSLINLCITNSLEKVANSGVVHVGINDHSFVFMTRKANYDPNGSRTIEMRQFKNFQKDKFLNDLQQMQWRNVSSHSDPNDMWQEWKNLFVS